MLISYWDQVLGVENTRESSRMRLSPSHSTIPHSRMFVYVRDFSQCASTGNNGTVCVYIKSSLLHVSPVNCYKYIPGIDERSATSSPVQIEIAGNVTLTKLEAGFSWSWDEDVVLVGFILSCKSEVHGCVNKSTIAESLILKRNLNHLNFGAKYSHGHLLISR